MEILLPYRQASGFLFAERSRPGRQGRYRFDPHRDFQVITEEASVPGATLQKLRQLVSGANNTSIHMPSYKDREGVFLSASWHTQQAREYIARLGQ